VSSSLTLGITRSSRARTRSRRPSPPRSTPLGRPRAERSNSSHYSPTDESNRISPFGGSGSPAAVTPYSECCFLLTNGGSSLRPTRQPRGRRDPGECSSRIAVTRLGAASGLVCLCVSPIKVGPAREAERWAVGGRGLSVCGDGCSARAILQARRRRHDVLDTCSEHAAHVRGLDKAPARSASGNWRVLWTRPRCSKGQELEGVGRWSGRAPARAARAPACAGLALGRPSGASFRRPGWPPPRPSRCPSHRRADARRRPPTSCL